MICPECKSNIPDDSVFCPKCGRDIKTIEIVDSYESNDSATEKSSKKMVWKGLFIIACVTCAIAIAGVIILLYQNNQLSIKLETSIADYDVLKQDYSKAVKNADSFEKKYKDAENEISDLEEELYEDWEKTYFLDRYIRIVGTDETYYHKYGCVFLDDSTFWAFNIDTAKQRYRACPYCN